MKPTPGYSHLPNKVCKLHQALHGFKQAFRAWFSKLALLSHSLDLFQVLMIQLYSVELLIMVVFYYYSIL